MNTRHAASRIFEMPDEYPDLPAIKRLIDPVTAASRFMVRSLLADPAIMDVAASPAGVVIIQVPDAGWLEPIADQWRMLARSGVDPVRGDADRVRQRGGNCGVVEVAIGQAAMVAIWVGTASMVGGVSSAIASVCM